MSIALPGLAVGGLAVNATTFIDLTKAGINGNPSFTQNPAHINVYNESGTGLLMTFDNDGASHIVPSGAWGQFDISAAVTRINFQVLYNLPNPQVTTLYVVYFQPNEIVLPIAIRGNSPSVVNNATINGTLTVQGDATLNGAGTGLAVTNNETVGGTLGVTGASTFTGDIAANGAGTGLAVANNETVGGTLTVTGDVAANGAGVGLAVANNETIGGTLVVTGDVTLNGATPSLTTANDITDNGNLSINKNLNFIDNGANKRLFATNDGTTNDFIIVNNVNHGLTHFRKSDALTDIMTLADTLIATFFGSINSSRAGVVTNGNTAGTVTLYMPFQGSGFKLAMLYFNGFRNTGANQNLVLPTAFSQFAFGWIGNINNPTVITGSTIQFILSGVAQSANVYNGMQVAPVVGTSLKAMEIIEVLIGFDTISLTGNAGETGNATASVILVGV